MHQKNSHTPTRSHDQWNKTQKYNLNNYIVANSQALTQLEPYTIQNTMNNTRTQAYGYTVNTTLIDITKPDADHIDIILSYNEISPPIQSHQTTTILHTKPHNRKWDPKSFLYTDGSQVKGKDILGAGVVNPRTQTITHIDIKSQQERHTINRAELAAITVAPDTKHRKSIQHPHR